MSGDQEKEMQRRLSLREEGRGPWGDNIKKGSVEVNMRGEAWKKKTSFRRKKDCDSV